MFYCLLDKENCLILDRIVKAKYAKKAAFKIARKLIGCNDNINEIDLRLVKLSYPFSNKIYSYNICKFKLDEPVPIYFYDKIYLKTNGYTIKKIKN